MPLLIFLLEIVTYLLINWNFIFQFLCSALMNSKKTYLYYPNRLRVLQLLLRRAQSSGFERDIKTPVFLCKDGLCLVHMNCPKQQVRMNHFLPWSTRDQEMGGFLLLPNTEIVFKKVLLHPKILKCEAFILCLAVTNSNGTFWWNLFLLVNIKLHC